MKATKVKITELQALLSKLGKDHEYINIEVDSIENRVSINPIKYHATNKVNKPVRTNNRIDPEMSIDDLL